MFEYNTNAGCNIAMLHSDKDPQVFLPQILNIVINQV